MVSEPKINILSDEEFYLFRNLILKESGIFFNIDQKDALSMNLDERRQETNQKSHRDYYIFLSEGASAQKELAALLDSITIGETDFFRTSAHFEVFRKIVLPEIVARKIGSFSGAAYRPNEPVIRIWSAGCSTGEEPYSLAMSVMEEIPGLVEQGAVSIIASDVNRERIAKAKQGIYKERAIKNLSPDFLYKYFTPTGHDARGNANYEINYAVKKLVKFFNHNLAKDSTNLDYMTDMDVIFCRNVLIYFDLPSTKKIIDSFCSSLNDDGYLFIGPAESLWQISDKFRPVEFPHVFVYKKQFLSVKEEEKTFINIPEIDLGEISFIQEEPSAELSAAMAEAAPKEEEKAVGVLEEIYQKGISLFKEKEYNKALDIFDEIIRGNPKFIQAYFAKATLLSNQGKYNEAIFELNKIIKVDNLFIEAYYLMGVLFDRLGDLNKAAEVFQKVIYINPEVVLAYFNLGNIFSYQKKFKKAQREFKNAIDILSKRPSDETVAFSEDVTTDVLLAACKKNIEAVRVK